uniref:HGGxSTG domain-containing protein n=1 Tax=Orrella sp. TaxID=1921583 RepID=UPI0040484E29
MLCGAKTRSGGYCQKHGMLNGRCRLHGGLSPKGRDHWNYQHGLCTKETRKSIVDNNAYLKSLEQLAIGLGMIEAKR